MENEKMVKESRSVRLPKEIFYSWNQDEKFLFFDSFGECKFAILLAFLGFQDDVSFQNVFYDFENYKPFYAADFCVDYRFPKKCENGEIKETCYKIFIDWKKVFTKTDFCKAMGACREIKRQNENPNINWCVRKLIYITNIFADILKDGKMKNIVNGYPDFEKMKKAFLELFEAAYNVSVTKCNVIEKIIPLPSNGFESIFAADKWFYPWNFDFFGGDKNKSVFFATNGFNPVLLNFEKYKNGLYPENFLDSLVVPTLSAYWNVARLELCDEPFGVFKHKYWGEKQFWVLKPTLREFKLQKMGNGKYKNIQQLQFESITTLKIQRFLDKIISQEA